MRQNGENIPKYGIGFKANINLSARKCSHIIISQFVVLRRVVFLIITNNVDYRVLIGTNEIESVQTVPFHPCGRLTSLHPTWKDSAKTYWNTLDLWFPGNIKDYVTRWSNWNLNTRVVLQSHLRIFLKFCLKLVKTQINSYEYF